MDKACAGAEKEIKGLAGMMGEPHGLILLSGLPCDERLWAAQAKGLVEGAGHFTPIEKPQAVTDALAEWLRAPEGGVTTGLGEEGRQGQ